MKNYLITGASRGLGAALTRHLTEQSHRVLAVARNEKALMKLKSETGADYWVLDLVELQKKDRCNSFETMLHEWGPLDGLVNNAGFLGKSLFEEADDDLMRNIFEVNYHAPSRLIKLLIPHFRNDVEAHIINIGSMGGFQGSAKFPGLAHYSASKAALASLTECLAEEYKSSNLRFNCLALGSVQTEMLAEAFPGYQASNKPEEMAAFVADFLLNGHRIFNGKVLPLSGLSV